MQDRKRRRFTKKSILTSVLFLVCLAFSCGGHIEGGESGDISPPPSPFPSGCVTKMAPDLDPPFMENTCDGIDGNVKLAIFVDGMSGRDENDGTTPDQPKKSIQSGIMAAQSLHRPQVYISKGIYSERVMLANGISLFGGYDAAKNWSRSVDHLVQIKGAVTERGTDWIGIQGQSISSQTVVSFIQVIIDKTAKEQSVYGFHCTECNAVVVDHVVIKTSNLAKQESREPGAPGASGLMGQAGKDSPCISDLATDVSDCPRFLTAGGAGGLSVVPGDHGGGDGGVVNCDLSKQKGQGRKGGAAGINKYIGDLIITFGGNGGNGDSAFMVASMPSQNEEPELLITKKGYWFVQTDRTPFAHDGIAGQNGENGSGGGGGGLEIRTIVFAGSYNAQGGGGGGAGGAGGGGMAGKGGFHGKHNIGLFVVDTKGMQVQHTLIQSGNAGDGGNGSNGGDAGLGGKGAPGGNMINLGSGMYSGQTGICSYITDTLHIGASGGMGGNGGNGQPGSGGNGGNGGFSIALLTVNSQVTTLDNDLKAGQAGQGGMGGVSGIVAGTSSNRLPSFPGFKGKSAPELHYDNTIKIF